MDHLVYCAQLYATDNSNIFNRSKLNIVELQRNISVKLFIIHIVADHHSSPPDVKFLLFSPSENRLRDD